MPRPRRRSPPAADRNASEVVNDVKSGRRKWLIAGLVTASLISVVIFFLIAASGDVRANTLRYEFAKTLLQLGLVSAAAAAASMLGFEFQREGQRSDKHRDEENRLEEKARDEELRQAEKARDEERRLAEKARDEERRLQGYRQELLEVTLGRATASYLQVKRARRLLRALARTTGADPGTVAIVASYYDEKIVEIIDAQLALESLSEHVRTSALMFSSADELARQLDGIEDYLSTLISEYEDARQKFVGEPPILALDALPGLDKFLASAKKEHNKFVQGFQRAKLGFLQVQTLIRQDLLDNLDNSGATFGDSGTRSPS